MADSIKETLTKGAVQLDEYWWLKADSDNWTLLYIKETLDEETDKISTSRSISYHGNLEQALKKYTSEALKPAENVLQLQVTLSKVFKQIKLFCHQIKTQNNG